MTDVVDRDLADLRRASAFLATPFVVDALIGLGQGRTPQQATPTDAPPLQVTAAIHMLVDIGAATYTTPPGCVDCPTWPILTAKGRHLMHLVEQICPAATSGDQLRPLARSWACPNR